MSSPCPSYALDGESPGTDVSSMLYVLSHCKIEFDVM